MKIVLISLLAFSFACEPEPIEPLNPNDYDSSCEAAEQCTFARTSQQECGIMAINISEAERANADLNALETDNLSICSFFGGPDLECVDELCVIANDD